MRAVHPSVEQAASSGRAILSLEDWSEDAERCMHESFESD